MLRVYTLRIRTDTIPLKKLIFICILLVLALPATADVGDAVRFERIVRYLTETSRAQPTEDSLLAAARRSLPELQAQSNRQDFINLLRQADDGSKLQTELINNMLGSLNDPWAKLLTPEQALQMRQRLEGDRAAGMGIAIVRSKSPAYCAVIEVTPDGPADGLLKPGDKILKANGVDTNASAFPEEVSGPAGKQVELLVEHEDKTRTNVFLTLDRVEAKTAYISDMDNGVIRISSFGEDTPRELKEAVAQLEGRPIIIDLRHNGGGYVKAAVASADLFLKKGDKVVTTVARRQTKTYKAANAPFTTSPVCLLVNSKTASAAEIFTAALDTHANAHVIGKKTYGKGSVQRFVSLPGDWALKYTTALYQTPDGVFIDKIGLTPDQPIDTPTKYISSKNDLQLESALQWTQTQQQNLLRAAK